VIRVGAPIKAEQAELKLRVEAALRSARSALQDGVVPGGGAALIGCVAALEAMRLDGDEAVGVKALSEALMAPMRSILNNAGCEPAPVLHEARRRAAANAAATVFDVVRREWVDGVRDGVADPLMVVLTALETAVSTAALALSADVLIRRKSPPQGIEP
jgi:chaperonin GroEL